MYGDDLEIIYGSDLLQLCERALHSFGDRHQTAKAIEELNELSIALARGLQGKASAVNIVEEIADCYIMLGQLQVMVGISNVQSAIRTKKAKLSTSLATAMINRALK